MLGNWPCCFYRADNQVNQKPLSIGIGAVCERAHIEEPSDGLGSPRKFAVEFQSIEYRPMGVIMPTILDLLYREYCRARLAEMRKQLLIATERFQALEADCHPADQDDENETKAHHKTGRNAPH